MFEAFDLPAELERFRDATLPGVLVLDCEREFESMPTDWVYELALFTEAIEPVRYPASWVPEDAPAPLRRLVTEEITIGLSGDGGVVRTTQTDPPIVFVKPRLSGAPDAFVEFLIAEAIVEIDLGHPEHFLGFFEATYPRLQTAVGGDPQLAYHLGVALYAGWRGLGTRDRFAGWGDSYPYLHEAWTDAGDRLASRVDDLPASTADGRVSFADACELACSAIKHRLAIPNPFAALDVSAYREQGAPFAIRWVERTLEALDDTGGAG